MTAPQALGHGIFGVDTRYVRQGLDASHLIVDSGRAAFVDTGVASSVPHLLGALDSVGVARDQVDFVLLTHVHLDHAGGAGLLLQSLPNARVVVHPRGARHVIDPSKLIAGSAAVYGEQKFRELYGQIVPIDARRVLETEDSLRLTLGARELRFLHTPGHASHHFCVYDSTARGIFSGDTFGISYREFDTAQGAFIFPTTTPVQFNPTEMAASIERLMSFEPESMFLTHYSRVIGVQKLAADLHADIDAFVGIASRAATTAHPAARIRTAMFAYLERRLRTHGVLLDAARIHEILDMDIDLNAQGLECWLRKDRRAN